MAQKKLSKKLYKINLLIKKGFKEKTENLFKKIFCISKKRKKINPIVKMNEAMSISGRSFTVSYTVVFYET